jgi:membrane-associated phospholipid phosphatase
MQPSIILSLNARMASSPLLTTIIPILWDIFVFSYPLYLIYLYFFTHDTMSRWKKLRHKNIDSEHKYNALTILGSFVGSIIINYIIKAFVQQPRPYQVLDLAINPKESLILNSIPSDSFPSDHAAVGMTIAISVLLLWYQINNKKMITIWRIFLGFALIMDISRITMGVHRPVDIIMGSIIWAFVAYSITRPSINKRLGYKIYNPIINFQEYLFSLIKK